MAEMFMNGPVAFSHPVSGKLVGPYEWYEGFSHREHEQTEAVPEETEKKPRRKTKEDE
jgi:hypothetical protein